LYAVVQEICGSAAAQSAGWRVQVRADPSEQWIFVRNERSAMRPQGWKLHVSAGAASAEAALCRALPVLLAEDASFKVAASIRRLADLNAGRGGMSQIGKFITVYPNDDAQAVRLAAALDQATRGLRGPAIPSDRPLAPGSLVYYRYGGFDSRSVQVPNGRVLPAIANPEDELIPDRRETDYYPPQWAVDPFVAAGVALPSLPEPGPLLADRYVVVELLHAWARGAVARAVDIDARRRCVLKRAGRDAQMRIDGRDARDGLRHEAEVLSQLAPNPRFPALFDLFEQDGDLILAMEDVQGETLDRHVSNLAARGCFLPTRQIVAWGRELATTLAVVHAQGLVFRDLKSSNVIVTLEGGLRLIDFGIAHELDSQAPPYGLGSYGYMSPQQSAGEPPAIADDIYGLGALLYYMATNAEPSRAPRLSALLDRPPAAINPAIGPALERVIARCLDPDRSARFPSMAAAEAALAEIGQEAAVAPPFGNLLSDGEEAAARRRSSILAWRLGEALCSAAQPASDGQSLLWPVAGFARGGAPLRELYSGAGGVVLALSELALACDQQEQKDVLARAARWLVASPRPQGHPAPGLYIGEAGVGGALLRAGHVLDDDTLVAAALERGRWIATLPYAVPDLMIGTAGRLRFHLLLWDATAEPDQLGAAIAAGDALLAASVQAGAGELCWPPGGESGDKCFVGYGHGAAGIADALLDLFEATGEQRVLEAALSAGRWLTRLAVPALDDGSGLAWPRFEGGPLAASFWCHGATGIGQFFLHAAELGVIPQAADLARRAARTIARGTKWADPTQCHGLAGNIEFLLDMFQATGDRVFLEQARSLAQMLEAFIDPQAGVYISPVGPREWESPSYMAGYAGVMACLLRLSNPESRPRGLSRRGFRYLRRGGECEE
jgi:serine/threonine protein kinase